MRANFAQVAGVANQRTDFPFLQPAFWQALQDTQVIGAGSDWPLQVLAGRVCRCLPVTATAASMCLTRCGRAPMPRWDWTITPGW